MSDSLVEDLRQEIANGQVIAVVGAGVSIGATHNNTVASWIGLLQHGVERCMVVVPNLGKGWADRVRSEIESGDIDDLLSAAEKIQTKLSSQGGEYSRWLRETVGALKPENRDVISALRELGVLIATTNYDSLIEQVTGLREVTWRESSQVERLIRGAETGVLHLHGHWRDAKSVVLGIRSYEQVLGDAHAQTIQQALRTMKTLLFIGYGVGLKDPNFGALLKWSRDVFANAEFRHYRLALRGEVAALQESHPPAERIYVLPFGDKHADLAPFLRDLRKKRRPDDDTERRKKHRDKVHRALADQLDPYFDDHPKKSPRDIAVGLEIPDIPSEPAKIREAILDYLLDRNDSIPFLNGLIREWEKKQAREAVEVLENCMDLILPFHFSPEVVATASGCLNQKGGGVLNGVVMTKCGAEIVMAALDQSDARFDPKDPELGGRHSRGGDFPALGKMSIDDDARCFLKSIMGSDSEESLARMQEWDRKDNKRTTYCVVLLPKESAEQDYVLKLLQRASEILPQLPILLLTTECVAKDHEKEYLRVLRRRFGFPER
jgi:SIR2-like domain